MIFGILFFSLFASYWSYQWLATRESIYLLKLLFNLLVIYFFITRKQAQKVDSSYSAIFIAGLHTIFPLLYGSSQSSAGLLSLSTTLLLGGLLLSIFAIIDLSESFGVLPADRGTKQTGLYRWVRHPLYLGYLIMHIGIIMFYWSWLNGSLFFLYLTLTHLRIQREEKFLSHSDDYIQYKNNVSYKVIPCIY